MRTQLRSYGFGDNLAKFHNLVLDISENSANDDNARVVSTDFQPVVRLKQ